MSKNSKNAQRIKAAKDMSATRKNGGKGPSKTTPKHGKTRAWWQTGDRLYRSFAKGKADSKQAKVAQDLETSGFVKRAAKPAKQQAAE